MPSQQYLSPDTMAKTTGYSQVVKVGNTVYIAGQVCMAPDGSTVGKDDPDAQARQIYRNLEAAAKSAGGSLESIVKTTTYMTNIQYGAAVRKARDEAFQSSDLPTSTWVVVSGLANPDWLIEIEAIAVLGD
jgi:enamine deaminase RidA (YjgF/YER057c/UK114 family)